MKKLICILLYSIISVGSLFANESEKVGPSVSCNYNSSLQLPQYRMMDVGTLGADRSYAISMNDKGQVLGRLYYGMTSCYFIWDIKEGLKILDLEGVNSNEFDSYIYTIEHINNKGQVTGRNYIWDPNIGSIYIAIPSVTIEKFNENFQGIGYMQVKTTSGSQSHLVIWDRGNLIDLIEELNKCTFEEWKYVGSGFINNQGHVAFSVQKTEKVNNLTTTISKSFLWKDGSFTMILPEFTKSHVSVGCMDDQGNMIAWVEYKPYFINSKGVIVAYLMDLSDIRNGYPIHFRHLPGESKVDLNGCVYISKGAEIKHLLLEEWPFFNPQDESTKIRDQNSQGWVIGNAKTIHSDQHAFIAIPQYDEDTSQ